MDLPQEAQSSFVWQHAGARGMRHVLPVQVELAALKACNSGV